MPISSKNMTREQKIAFLEREDALKEQRQKELLPNILKEYPGTYTPQELNAIIETGRLPTERTVPGAYELSPTGQFRYAEPPQEDKFQYLYKDVAGEVYKPPESSFVPITQRKPVKVPIQLKTKTRTDPNEIISVNALLSEMTGLQEETQLPRWQILEKTKGKRAETIAGAQSKRQERGFTFQREEEQKKFDRDLLEKQIQEYNRQVRETGSVDPGLIQTIRNISGDTGYELEQIEQEVEPSIYQKILRIKPESTKQISLKKTTGKTRTIEIRASDGSTHTIPADKLNDAKKIDPKLTVIRESP